MAEITRHIDLDLPAVEVWANVVDWRQQHHWIPATRVTPLTADGRGVGARIHALTGLGAASIPDEMEITVWEPPRRCLVRHLGPVIRGTGAFEVEPLPGDRARFTWSEWIDPPLGMAGDVLFPLVKPALEAAYDLSLRRFAQWAASRR